MLGWILGLACSTIETLSIKRTPSLVIFTVYKLVSSKTSRTTSSKKKKKKKKKKKWILFLLVEDSISKIQKFTDTSDSRQLLVNDRFFDRRDSVFFFFFFYSYKLARNYWNLFPSETFSRDGFVLEIYLEFARQKKFQKINGI